MDIKIKIIKDGKAPEYKTKGAACADCYARIAMDSITLGQNETCLVNLGFALELPEGYEAVIRPRSGISKDVLCVTGTIDSDYRGEIKARIFNYGKGSFIINNGDRICQIKIQKADQFNFIPCNELSETIRGNNGFGSTGK